MKHKHCDLIKAWADGAEIQYYHEFCKTWVHCPNPSWDIEMQYRIKPEKTVIKYRLALRKVVGKYTVDAYPEHFYGDVERSKTFIQWITEEQTLEINE